MKSPVRVSSKNVPSPRTPSPHVLKGRDIVTFSNDWTGDPLSKNHLMRLLARENRVLWVNSIGNRSPAASAADASRAFRKLAAATAPVREVEPNLFVLNPLIIPMYGRPAVTTLNRHLLAAQVRWSMRKLGFRNIINWTFLPTAGMVAGHLGEDLVIYQCVDEYAAFSDAPTAAVAEMEQTLLKRADLVLVSAERLYRSKIRSNPRTQLVRHGVDFNHFRQALDPQTKVPTDIASLPRPVIGFFGLIADWVDVDLMADVARRFPEASLVVIGKTTTDVSALRALPNVRLLGRKPYAALPGYCKGFDVALMPFRINELTLNSNPLKVREYLAAGLPVISTPIPEVEVLGLCRIASGGDNFEREIRAALTQPGPSIDRSESVRQESWQARIEEIEGHLAKVLDAR